MLKKFFNLKTIIFITLIILLLLLIPKIYGLVMLLFAAFVFAAALNPYVNKLQNKTHNRTVAAIIIVLCAIVAIFALILPIVIMCFKEIQLLVEILPEKLNSLGIFMNNLSFHGHSIGNHIPPIENLVGASSSLTQDVLSRSIDFTMTMFQAVFIILALTMFVFYILIDKTYLKEKFIEFFPPNIKEKAAYILSDITSKVGNYVRAQVLSMIAVGVMVAVTLAFLGVDYTVLLGLIAGVCEIIPVLGPTIALLTIVAIAAPLGMVKVILSIVLFLIIQQISNYGVKPFLFGKFMKLHPITILVALFIAQEFLGIWGVILSPAIAATICVLVDELYLNPINEKEITNIE